MENGEWKQQDLPYGDKEQFREKGMPKESLQVNGFEDTPLRRAFKFVSENRKNIEKILERDKQLGGMQIEELSKKFLKTAGTEDFSWARKLLVMALTEDEEFKPSVTDAVVENELGEGYLNKMEEARKRRRLREGSLW
jgi:hypothetical protein